MNDVADSVTCASALVENFLNLFTIRESDRCARGVGGKLGDDVSRHRSLLVIEQEPFEFSNVFEGTATGQGAESTGSP
jgi:hypothetical protein